MPKYNPGDIITKSSDWGTTTALVVELNDNYTFTEDSDYYCLLYLEHHKKHMIGTTMKLTVSLIDNVYKPHNTKL